MKILIINTVPYKRNGVTSVIYQYYHAMKGLHQIDFAGINDVNDLIKQDLEERGGCNYILDWRNQNPICLIRLCRKGKYDVVHAHGNSSTLAIEMIAARCAGIKKRIAHGHASLCEHQLAHRILKHILLSNMTTGIACSHMAGEFLFGTTQFNVLNNAFDVDEYVFSEKLRQEQREKLMVNGKHVIGYVATLTETKNHRFLFEVYNQIKKTDKNALMLLIGKGPEEESLKELAKQYGFSENEVQFLGERSDVNKLMNVFDVVLFPSKNEGLGIALLEAQANGLPVIASKDVIPSCVKINDNFFFEEVNNTKQWVKRYSAINFERVTDGGEKVKAAGFDIKTEVNKLKRIYLER